MNLDRFNEPMPWEDRDYDREEQLAFERDEEHFEMQRAEELDTIVNKYVDVNKDSVLKCVT